MVQKNNKATSHTDLLSKKSTWAALATLGVTAIAAGATAFVKVRNKRRQQQEQESDSTRLTADQLMVYNEAVNAFMVLNDRIYNLRSRAKELQPYILWLATEGEKPQPVADDEELQKLSDDIARFLATQLPFINACLSTVSNDGLTYADYIRGPIGGTFDSALDEAVPGTNIEEGAPIKQVLKLGFYFPHSTLAPNPVKSIVTS
jgi:hypothetical protein